MDPEPRSGGRHRSGRGHISFDGNIYLKEKEDLPIRDLYEKLANDSSLYPKTALPSIGDYQKKFEKYLKENKDIICVCLSSKFSGSFNSAIVARNNLIDKYPGSKITVIDSTHATALQTLFVLELAKMKMNNVPYDQIIEIVPELKSSGRIYFTVGNLEYLIEIANFVPSASNVDYYIKIVHDR